MTNKIDYTSRKNVIWSQGGIAGRNTTPRSRSSRIPMPASHIPRTQSELQITADEEAARHRETAMFCRLVNGIRAKQAAMSPTFDAHCPPYTANNLDPSLPSCQNSLLAATGHTSPTSDMVPSDGWSMTGFEEENEGSFEKQYHPLTDSCSRFGASSTSFVCSAKDMSEEEGVFDFDL